MDRWTNRKTIMAQIYILLFMCAHGMKLAPNCLNILQFGQAILAESSRNMFSPPHLTRKHHLNHPDASGPKNNPKIPGLHPVLARIKISGRFWVKLKIIPGRRGMFSTINTWEPYIGTPKWTIPFLGVVSVSRSAA
jgi:hypothetical protein